MDTKSDKTAKKFSFRKRRSSKGKKEGEMQPVDLETEQQATVATQNCENNAENSTVAQEFIQTPTNTVDDKAIESSGEDPGQKSISEPASGGKKKSKRRSLFKRNGKKNAVEESCELRVKESENTVEKSEEQKDGEGSFAETTVENVLSSVEPRQVVENEITEQSDGEGYLSVGETSEAEGLFDEDKGSSPESVTIEGDKGTKRKSFFKRGLSLKRRKSKKQTSESKEDSVTTEQPNNDETTTTLENSGAADNEQIKDEAPTENSEGTENNELKTNSETMSNSAVDKQPPVKPARKVSFIGPDGMKLDSSSDEGDSPTEPPVEAGDESDADTITGEVTGEDGPSEVSEKVSEIVAPEVLVIVENTECSETFPEGDDDDLTEVSSLASDLITSSDAQDTISTSDTSRLFTLTDTDDNGSRITLEEISEESEPNMETTKNVPEDKIESNVEEETGTHSKLEVADEEVGSEGTGTESKQEVVGTGFESRPESDKVEDEATKLLAEGSKVGEWEMVNKSYDMSVELSRVRKQTLFGVKRLCCSVM